MKTRATFILGVIVGMSACGGAWLVHDVREAQAYEHIMRAHGDGAVMLGGRAAEVLADGSPEALRDSVNYAVDSGLMRTQRGDTTCDYTSYLSSKIATIPAERRALSRAAPQV